MSKRIVLVRNARIVPAESIWPGRCTPEQVVLLAELASEHPVLGADIGAPIRTSLVQRQDLALGVIETLNTIYKVIL